MISIKKVASSLLLVPALAFMFSVASVPVAEPAGAARFNQGIQDGADAGQGDDQPGNLFNGDGAIFTTITNVLLFLIGAVSVIMLIIGGIRYTLSGGDQTAVTAAKNTILYAVIGIIVAILAYAIVNFVVGSFAR